MSERKTHLLAIADRTQIETSKASCESTAMYSSGPPFLTSFSFAWNRTSAFSLAPAARGQKIEPRVGNSDSGDATASQESLVASAKGRIHAIWSSYLSRLVPVITPISVLTPSIRSTKFTSPTASPHSPSTEAIARKFLGSSSQRSILRRGKSATNPTAGARLLSDHQRESPNASPGSRTGYSGNDWGEEQQTNRTEGTSTDFKIGVLAPGGRQAVLNHLRRKIVIVLNAIFCRPLHVEPEGVVIGEDSNRGEICFAPELSASLPLPAMP